MYLKKVISSINLINEKIIHYLPVHNSLLPFHIITTTMSHHMDGKELSLKGLSMHLEWSQTGIRKHVDRLSKDGWVIIDTSSTDKRVKYIKPSQKLIDCCRGLANEITTLIK